MNFYPTIPFVKRRRVEPRRLNFVARNVSLVICIQDTVYWILWILDTGYWILWIQDTGYWILWIQDTG